MTRQGPARDPFATSEWWAEEGFLFGLHTLLDPVRIPYFRVALASTPEANVLDVGCGGGFVSSGLGSAGYRMTGLDIASSAIDAARQNSSGSFVVGDARSLPFPDDIFDAVVCSEVIEHVEQHDSVIAECARVLRPGGRFLFSTPNRTILSRILLIDMAQRWSPTRVLPQNLHRWSDFVTPSELTKALADNGLEVEDVRGVTIPLRHLPAAALALFRLKRGDIGFAEAGRRIRLGLGRATAVAYIGEAVSLRTGPS